MRVAEFFSFFELGELFEDPRAVFGYDVVQMIGMKTSGDDDFQTLVYADFEANCPGKRVLHKFACVVFAVDQDGTVVHDFCLRFEAEHRCCENLRELLKFPVALCLCFMKLPTKNIEEFFKSPVGTLVVFVILFYVMTFAVYYFYSPGPEERKQAAAELANRTQSQQIQDVVNN